MVNINCPLLSDMGYTIHVRNHNRQIGQSLLTAHLRSVSGWRDIYTIHIRKYKSKGQRNHTVLLMCGVGPTVGPTL